MEKYEYKFVNWLKPYTSDYSKIEEVQNELGRQGWKYCTDAQNAVIFIREIGNTQNNKEE